MRAADVIRAPKVVTDWGKWTSDQMGKAVFPLTKRRSGCLRYGTSHRWSLIRFTALSRQFRILVVYRPDIAEFKAHLALEQSGGDMTVLCSWEYHGTHPGWHMHVCCKDESGITSGVVRPAGGHRLPRAGEFHRSQRFPADKFSAMNDNAAITIVMKRFKLDPPDLLTFREGP